MSMHTSVCLCVCVCVMSYYFAYILTVYFCVTNWSKTQRLRIMSIYYASQVNEVAGWFLWSLLSKLSGRLSKQTLGWAHSQMVQNDSWDKLVFSMKLFCVYVSPPIYLVGFGKILLLLINSNGREASKK